MAIDDNTIYGLTGAQVKELPGKIEAVKGSARDLTSDDYDWPTDNPQRVALWKLPSGIYTHEQANIAINRDSLGGWNQYLIIIDSTKPDTDMLLFNHDEMLFVDKVRKSDGYSYGRRTFLESTDVVNNLTSTSTTTPLSAAQGKVLNEKIEGRIINGGTTAPTTATVGAVGTLYSYVDTTGTTPEPHLMVCTVADTVTPTYTWVDVMGSVATALHQINNGVTN